MQGLSEMFNCDSGTIGPQMRLQVIVCVLHLLIYQEEQLIVVCIFQCLIGVP